MLTTRAMLAIERTSYIFLERSTILLTSTMEQLTLPNNHHLLVPLDSLIPMPKEDPARLLMEAALSHRRLTSPHPLLDQRSTPKPTAASQMFTIFNHRSEPRETYLTKNSLQVNPSGQLLDVKFWRKPLFFPKKTLTLP
jgi:hypothetical protein